MELQELTKIWKDYDGQLDNKLKINHRILKSISMDKVKSMLSEFRISSIIELLIEIPFVYYLIHFVIGQWLTIQFVLPALILIALMLLSVTLNAYKLSTMMTIGYNASVIGVQKKLQRLWYYERMDINSLYVAIPVFTFCFFIVFAKALLGINLYHFFGIWWGYHLLGTLVIAIIIVWFLKKFPDKNMAKAMKFLEEIKGFEQEG